MSLLHVTALCVTLTAESIGSALYAVWREKAGPDIRRIVLIVAGVNLVTHTLFWYSYPTGFFDQVFELLCFEIAIVGVEGAIYSRLVFDSLRESSGVSAVLNLVSFLAGELAWRILLARLAG